VPVPKTKEEEAAEKYASQNNIPDVSVISAFMTQAADLIECVQHPSNPTYQLCRMFLHVGGFIFLIWLIFSLSGL